MFCESAQRECSYLGVVDDLRQASVLFQATEERAKDVKDAQKVADACEELIANVNGPTQCSVEACGVLRETVINSIINNALH